MSQIAFSLPANEEAELLRQAVAGTIRYTRPEFWLGPDFHDDSIREEEEEEEGEEENAFVDWYWYGDGPDDWCWCAEDLCYDWNYAWYYQVWCEYSWSVARRPLPETIDEFNQRNERQWRQIKKCNKMPLIFECAPRREGLPQPLPHGRIH